MTYIQGRLIHRDEITRPRNFSQSMLQELADLGAPRLRLMLIEPDEVFMHDNGLNRIEFQDAVRQALRLVS